MSPLLLHEFHRGRGARFSELNGAEIVADYGDWLAEYHALRESVGVVDLSFRGRLCLLGNDRVRFLHGQITNDVKKLRVGQGCYAALTTAKGKMESDLNVFILEDELLLDFEPGLTEKISQRLEKFIVADDVQIADAAPHYGLLSVQGPMAARVMEAAGLAVGGAPEKEHSIIKMSDAALGDVYVANLPRLSNFRRSRGHEARVKSQNQLETPDVVSYGYTGFDIFAPNRSLEAAADKLLAGAKSAGGRVCGWTAFEAARIEMGLPRFGADMNETNFPPECGIESRAMSYSKGCYIGQEVLNRIHTMGHVTKELRGLRLADDLKALPRTNDKLFHNGKEVGYVTSAVRSPALEANIALGYVRHEAGQIGTELTLRTAQGERRGRIVELPF